jgi:drug/metabolite transporter (DMT)-like permease
VLLGEIAGILTSLCWTFTALFFTEASKRLGPFQVNLIRLPGAFVLLFLSYVLVGKSLVFPPAPTLLLALSGIVGLVLGDTCLFESLVRIGARRTLLVFSLSPGMTAVLAYLYLGETIGRKGILGILLTLAGIVIVISARKGDGDAPRGRIWSGVFFAALGGLGQAGGLILAKQAFRYNVDPLFATLIRILAAALTIWPTAALIGKLTNPVRLLRRRLDALPYLAGGIILGPFVGIWLSLVSVKYAETGVAATLMSLMPILVLPVERILYGTRVEWRGVTGAVLAVTGVALLFLRGG